MSAAEREALARLSWQALQLGEPVLLDEVEMDRVVAGENGVCPRFWA